VSSDRLAGPIVGDVALVGCSLTEGPVGAARVVVLDVLVEQSFEMRAVPYERAVCEFAAHGADPTFRVCVRDGDAYRRADDRRALGAEHVVERRDELAAVIADQESNLARVAHREVAGGLSRPIAGRVAGDAGEMDATGIELDEEQDVVTLQEDGVDMEEIACEDPARL